MGWLIALAVIVCIACLPVGISARYDEKGAFASLITGPIHIPIYPARSGKKDKKADHKKKAEQQETGKKATGHPTAQKGGSYKEFLPIVRIVLEFLDAFRSKLRVDRLELKLILAGEDPCDLAVNYGKAWAALGNLMPHLERVFVIRKRDLAVECDFIATDTVVIARTDLTITVGRLLYITCLYGVRAIYHYFKIMNQRKGGANI